MQKYTDILPSKCFQGSSSRVLGNGAKQMFFLKTNRNMFAGKLLN